MAGPAKHRSRFPTHSLSLNKLMSDSHPPLDASDSRDAPSAAPPDPGEDDDFFRPLDRGRFVRQTFIGLIVLLVLLGGWWLMQRQRLARQDQLAARLKELGAEVLYDTEFDENGRRLPAERQSGGLLTLIFGSDPFRVVEGLVLGPEFETPAIEMLPQLPQLRQLTIGRPLDATELGRLVQVGGRLERLELATAWRPDDEAWRQLAALPKLEDLILPQSTWEQATSEQQLPFDRVNVILR